MTYLVDSDWLVDYLLGRPDATALLNPLFADGLAISIITYAEIYQGIYFGRDPSGAEALFRRFLHDVRVLGVTRPIARRCARLRGDLRTRGVFLPQPDLFIVLLTRNLRHFGRVPGLRLHQSP